MKADITLDCVGLYCPMPIFKTAMKMKELKPGKCWRIVGDDKGSKKDMPSGVLSTAMNAWG